MKPKKLQYLMAVLCTAFAMLLPALALAQAPDNQAPPVVRQSSWGQVKVLYRGVDSTQAGPSVNKPVPGQFNERDQRVGPFPGGDWSSRIVWEARYALSSRADGSSKFPVYRDASRTLIREFYGDWNYAGSDPYAFDRVMRESGYQYGNHWPGTPHNSNFSHQGTCTWFVREVLYRATYWAGYGWHVTTPGYPSTVWSWTDTWHMTQNYGSAKPGWVISSPYNHMAILEARAWDFGGWGWWVIDSNWVGGKGNELIGKHFMLDTTLRSSNYWAWCPTLATTN